MHNSMEKRNVILGVAGSIAVVKSAEFARLMVSRGFEVRVVMTSAAAGFLNPHCFEAITGNPVITEFTGPSGFEASELATLAAWADCIVLAPATADEIAKIRGGHADSPILAAILASSAPLVLAPAMHPKMLSNKKTQENIRALREEGVKVLLPGRTDESVGVDGIGRMTDPWQLFYETRQALSLQDYAHKHLVIATGSSREYLDSVRYFARRSSGKMGIALAREAHRRGAKVTLVHGPIATPVPRAVQKVRAVTTDDMNDKILSLIKDETSLPDVVIMAAALSDYSPAEAGKAKLHFDGPSVDVKLMQNPDVLVNLGQALKGTSKRPLLVGFSETSWDDEEPLETLRAKIDQKGVDVLVGNVIEERLQGENHHWVLDRLGRQTEVSSPYKSRVADSVLSAIARLF